MLMKLAKRLWALCLALTLTVLAGCGKAKGEGFTLSVSLGDGYETLDPIYAETAVERSIIAHLYENLMKLSVDAQGNTTAAYGLVKSVDQQINVDGTVTYTFRLRSAKWSDGQAVTADDVVYAWQRLACPVNDSPHAELMSVVCGYEQVRQTGDATLLQVSAKNENTLVVNLSGNYTWFLEEVCTDPAAVPVRRGIVPTLPHATEEAVETASEGPAWWADVKSLVVSGPYIPESQGTEYLRLVENERYYDYGKTPGPDGITFRFADSAQEGVELYEKGEVDAVWPVELTEDNAIPTLSTYALIFNCTTFPFQDRALRQATVKAIDRNAAAALAGGEAAGALVPYGVPDSEAEDFRSCAGALVDNTPELYAENCAQAMEILQNAGYQSGADLGELRFLYLDEGTNGLVAGEVCRQLSDMLKMKATPVAMAEEELFAAVESGEFSMVGLELTSFYNDPEGFLMDWTSHAAKNVAGYENTAYDTLMSIIVTAPDGTARLGCLHDAEELLIDDAPLTPLYTTYTAWDIRDTLTGAFRDERGWFGFMNVIRRTA